MFRDGLLSPRSKLLPGGTAAPLSLYLDDEDAPSITGARATSVLSLASTGASRSLSSLLPSFTVLTRLTYARACGT